MLAIFPIIAFVIFSAIIFYIPGKFLLGKLGIKLGEVEETVTATTLGIFIFVLLSLLVRFLKLPFFIATLIELALALSYLRKIKIMSLLKKPVNLTLPQPGTLILWLILLSGIITQGWIHFFSGIATENNLSFLPFRDASFHLSLIGEFKNHFPPQNPFFAGVPLKNYHFLGDFLIAGVNSTFPIPLFDLYFRFLPVFVSLFYGLAVYIVASNLTPKIWVRNLAVFLAFFAGPFSYLIPLFKKGASWDAFSFTLNQPFDLSFNPQSVLGFIIFLLGLFFLLEYQKQKNKNLLYLSAVIFALAFGFKFYASALGIGAFLTTALYMFIFKKEALFIRAFLLSVLIFSASFFLLIDNFRNGLHFAPGWTLKRMVEDPGNLNIPDFTLREQHYLEKNNLARVIQINLEETAMYTFGNLGVRVLGFLYLLSLLQKPLTLPPGIIFILASTLTSFFIPIIFNQGGSPYNIIQFGVFSLFITSIFSAIALEKIATRVGIDKNRLILGATVTILILLAIPANIKTFSSHLKSEHFLVPEREVQALTFLKNQTPKDAVILLYPSEKNRDSAYVSALSQRRVFLAHLAQVDIVNLSYNEREKEAWDFFHQWEVDQQKEFITKNKISYIYLTKENQQELEKKSRKLSFRPLIETGQVGLYQTD